MKAILIENNELVLSDVNKPEPQKGEVLIKIYAAALNRADLLQRKGTYPSPPGWPQWPGLEVSGVIESVGAESDCKFKVGDKVCALLGGGGYAEYICVPCGMVMPMPGNLTFEQAATLPEAYATSYLNLYIEGNLKPGQTAFIPAGASGIASVAIPMAKALGSRVITSVLSDKIAEKIKNLGADIIINSTTQDVAEVLKEEADNGRPVSVALDCLSGETLGKAIVYMAEGGYWVIISTLAGAETTVNLRPVLQKGLHLVGSMLRKRSVEEKTEILSKLVEVVWPKIESGEMVPSIYKVLPLEKADEAMDILESGTHVGKVVLSVCK